MDPLPNINRFLSLIWQEECLRELAVGNTSQMLDLTTFVVKSRPNFDACNNRDLCFQKKLDMIDSHVIIVDGLVTPKKNVISFMVIPLVIVYKKEELNL